MALKTICLALALSFCLGVAAPVAAAEAQKATDAENRWKRTVEGLDLLSLSVMPTIEREVRIDPDNIWPETEAIQEELIVPLNTVISYQAGPAPTEEVGLTIQQLFNRQSTEDDLELYVNYTSNDTDALIFVDVFYYSLVDEAVEWPPTDEERSISYTFTEAGMYGVNAVYMDSNEESFPASIYLVIKVVEDATITDKEPIDKEPKETELPQVKPSDVPAEVPTEPPGNNDSDTITFMIGSSVVTQGEELLPEPPLAPQMINGHRMLPFRYLVETVLEGSVEYAAPTRTITAKIADRAIVMTIDSVQIYVDGEVHEFGQPPVVIDGTTLAPLEAFEAFLGKIIEVG